MRAGAGRQTAKAPRARELLTPLLPVWSGRVTERRGELLQPAASGRRSQRKEPAGGAAGEGRQHLPGPAAELPSPVPAPSFPPPAQCSCVRRRFKAGAVAAEGCSARRRCGAARRARHGTAQHGAVTRPARRYPPLSWAQLCAAVGAGAPRCRHVALGPAPRWVPRAAAGPAGRARSSVPTHSLSIRRRLPALRPGARQRRLG